MEITTVYKDYISVTVSSKPRADAEPVVVESYLGASVIYNICRTITLHL